MKDEKYPGLKIELKTFELHKYCPDCFNKPNDGCILKFNGLVLASNPPQYPHKCINCDKIFNLKNIYPLIVYE